MEVSQKYQLLLQVPRGALGQILWIMSMIDTHEQLVLLNDMSRSIWVLQTVWHLLFICPGHIND